MHIRIFIPVLLILVAVGMPGTTHAGALVHASTIVLSEPAGDNQYLAGNDITIAAPLGADLFATAGTLSVLAPVAGDIGLAGATIHVRKPVAGDVRIVGGNVEIDSAISGDLLVAARSITASTTARDMHLAGGTVTVNGSGGEVTIYGADVFLSGVFAGDVTVTASDKLVIEEGTRIEGMLNYDAPEQVTVPATAEITAGVTYTGSSAFLPTNEEARRFALAGAGVLLIVKVLAMVVAAGVVVGLFPHLARMVAERVIMRSPRRSILYALLGFGVIIATPVLIVLLLISFVGITLAILLLALYVLLLILAYLYAGLIAGSALSRAILKRDRITWRTAVLGTLALFGVSVVPIVGPLVVCVLTSCALGALIAITYQAGFGQAGSEDQLEEDILA